MAQAAHNMTDKDNAPKDGDTLYLVDGSGFIFRAYHAMPPLTRPDGTPVGAVYGFVNMMVKLLTDFHAPYIAVVFDAKRKNFRNDIYEEYKANRDEPPEDLIPQFGLIREATEAFDIPALELEGYEADDLIASYAKLAADQGRDVVIVGSDKDLMQLVTDTTRMYDPMKQQFIDPKAVEEKFGVAPDKVIDVQALSGDSIDNVPGVPGIGPKIAAELINQYGDLNALLENAEDIKQPKRRENLIEHSEAARISKQLVTLASDVEVPLALDDLKTRDPDSPQLVEFLREQGFKTLIARLEKEVDLPDVPKEIANPDESGALLPGEEPLPDPRDNAYTLITDEKTLKDWMEDALETGLLSIDTETTSLKPGLAGLVGISISSRVGKAAYIPLGHTSPAKNLFDDGSNDDMPDQLSTDKVIEIITPVLTDKSILKIAHNMKYDWQILSKAGVDMTPVEDTMLLSYILDGTDHSHSMDELAALHLEYETIKYADVAGSGKSQVTFDQVPVDKALDYAAEDAEITLRLYHRLRPRIVRETKTELYETIERPLIKVLAKMEQTGVKVDAKILNEMSKDFAKNLETLEKDIHELAGTEFNVASPKQIGKVLFDDLGLEGGKKTKSGDWSTNASILEELAAKSVDEGGHEIVQKILDWRSMAKLKSTYTDALQEDINPDTGRVHSSFMMTGTSTGRLASRDPNLQNIPIRTEAGRKIRTAFVAEQGCKILSVDYSQVELRLAAELADIKNLKQAFKDGKDIHALTAARVFDVDEDKVDSDLRRQAKAINFGIIYGISGWGLAQQIGCSAAEGTEFIKRYLSRFPELNDFMESCKQFARDHGYVETLFGRKCVIHGIKDKNGARRAAAERQAINAPLQGTAADIMKKAMVKMGPALKDAGLNARMILQIHDELIFEVPEKELEKTEKLVKQVMENVVQLDVPLIAEAEYANSWAEAH